MLSLMMAVHKPGSSGYDITINTKYQSSTDLRYTTSYLATGDLSLSRQMSIMNRPKASEEAAPAYHELFDTEPINQPTATSSRTVCFLYA
jgi:hypothetical protein